MDFDVRNNIISPPGDGAKRQRTNECVSIHNIQISTEQ